MCPWMLVLFQQFRPRRNLMASSSAHSPSSKSQMHSNERKSLALSLKDASVVFHDNRQLVVSLLRDSANQMTFNHSNTFEYPSGLLGCIYDFACGADGVDIERDAQYLMCFTFAGNQSDTSGSVGSVNTDHTHNTLALGTHEIECFPWGLRCRGVVCYNGHEAHREQWAQGDTILVRVDTRRGEVRVEVEMKVDGCDTRPMGIVLDSGPGEGRKAQPLHVAVGGAFALNKGIKLDSLD